MIIKKNSICDPITSLNKKPKSEPIIRPLYLHISCLVTFLLVLMTGLLVMFKAEPLPCSQQTLSSCTTVRCCEISKNNTCVDRIHNDCLSYPSEIALHKTVVGIVMALFFFLVITGWIVCWCYGTELHQTTTAYYDHLGNIPQMPVEMRPMTGYNYDNKEEQYL